MKWGRAINTSRRRSPSSRPKPPLERSTIFRRRHVKPPPPLATKAGQRELQDAAAADHQKSTHDPKKEYVWCHPLLLPHHHGRRSTAHGDTTLPRSTDLRGYLASSSPAPPQVALPRWGSSCSPLIPTRRRLPHPDDVPLKPRRNQAEPLPDTSG
jgi:hypothetical protein